MTSAHHTCRHTNDNSGFTLIELILYIGLAAIFLTGATYFALDVLYGREKAYQQQVVEQNAKLAMNRIAYEIRRAKNVTTVNPTQLVLSNGGAASTTIVLSSGVIQITTGGAGPYALTSNQTAVTALTFTSLNTANNNSKDIHVSMTLRQANAAVPGQFEATTTLAQSIELKGAFNQARSLIMNSSAATLTNSNRRISNTTLQNQSSSLITVDTMTVSWTGGAAGSLLDHVRINGTDVYSNPNVSSGTEINITNVALSAAASPTTVNYIAFTGNMSGATITVRYTLLDGSTLSNELLF